MDNLKKIKSISIVNEVQELSPNTPDSGFPLDASVLKKAKENLRKISVYRISYKSNAHNVIGFLIEPKKGKNLPCIIWNRSGSNEFGAIRPQYLFTNHLAQLALAGYVVITTQYSGNGGSEGKDEMGGADVNDILGLYTILKNYYKVDKKRIGMYGISRGGMMALIILSKVNWLRALVLISPLTNLLSSLKQRPEMKKIFKNMFGGSKKDLIKRSPVYWVNKLNKKAPILIMQGTADWRVDISDTFEIAKKMYKEKIPFRLLAYEGDDHALTINKKSANQNTIEWFDRFVKNSEQLPLLKKHGF